MRRVTKRLYSKHWNHCFLFSVMVSFMISGCTQWVPPGAPMPPLDPEYDAVVPGPRDSAMEEKSAAGVSIHSLEIVDLIVPYQGDTSADGPSMFDPSDTLVLDDSAPDRRRASDLLLVSVEGMDLNRFIHLIFGKYLGVNYVVDPDVEQRLDPVTIHMQESVTRPVFTKLVRELLRKYNVVVQERSATWFIEPVKGKDGDVEEFLPMVGRSIPDSFDDTLQLLLVAPVNNIKAAQAMTILGQMYTLPSTADVRPISESALIFKGDVGVARKILDLLSIVDQPFFQEQHVRLIRLKYLDTSNFLTRLEEIMPPLGIPINSDGKGGGVTIVPVPEIASLLLVAPEKSWLQTIRSWSDRLDIPSVLGPEPRIFIYRPKNRKAAELAQVIMGLRGEQGPTKTTTKVKKNLNSTKVTETQAVQSPIVGTGASVLKNEELNITVDETRNVLVIFASPESYAELERNLDELDILARQVLIEVTIAEVTLTDELQYGVEWYLRNQGGDWNYVIQTIDRLALGDGGVLGTFAKTSGNFVAMLNAFAKDDRVKILASPKIVVLDNESATFSVGTDVPVVTSEATADDLTGNVETGPSVLRNIQYRQTGISMNVTPTIYSNGILRLEIDQNVSEAQKNDVSPDTGSPLVLDRSLTTTVILRSGEYILVAGLISESGSSGNQRVPLLGDIPWLGNLFKTTSFQTTRTELMIQVRPIILDSLDDARYETVRFEQALIELKELSQNVFYP